MYIPAQISINHFFLRNCWQFENLCNCLLFIQDLAQAFSSYGLFGFEASMFDVLGIFSLLSLKSCLLTLRSLDCPYRCLLLVLRVDCKKLLMAFGFSVTSHWKGLQEGGPYSESRQIGDLSMILLSISGCRVFLCSHYNKYSFSSCSKHLQLEQSSSITDWNCDCNSLTYLYGLAMVTQSSFMSIYAC